MAKEIQLSGATRLSELLSAYPWLKEELAKVHERFKLLNTPLAKVMMAKATVAEMSQRSGMEESALIGRLEELIAARAEAENR